MHCSDFSLFFFFFCVVLQYSKAASPTRINKGSTATLLHAGSTSLQIPIIFSPSQKLGSPMAALRQCLWGQS